MKKFCKTSRILPILAVAAGLLPVSNAVGNQLNLVTGTAGAVTGGSFATGTTAGGENTRYQLIDTIPAGTGVFQPFLSYQKKGAEEGVNTSLGGNGQGFLDDKRVPQWTHDLKFGDLLRVGLDLLPVATGGYYAFELDANETGVGNPNRLLSIDDIRIYTKATDPFAGMANDTQVHTAIANDTLGTLRYAQNQPGGTANNYVVIDASRRTEGSTSGSGSSDMIVLVPASLFNGTGANDFVAFYTINGVAHSAGDFDANAGFEEWRALTTVGVPDGGSTLLLLGSVFASLGLFARGRKTARID